MTGERRIAVGAVLLLGAIVAAFLYFGNAGATRPEVDPIDVGEILDVDVPAERWGSDELHVVGWYAELRGDCEGDDGGADESVAWLQRECPLRVLLRAQPPEDVTQDELLRDGLRLAAPLGNRFPSRAQPGGPNLRSQPLVFVGHFADAAAGGCVPDRRDRCRNTFVVTDYDELYR